MSKEETKNISEEEQTESTDAEEDIVDMNVGALKVDILLLKKENDELKQKLAVLTEKYSNALDILEEDTKASIIADIAPKTTIPRELLQALPLDELRKRQKILDTAKVPAFKSGTPLVSVKDSPEAKLANMNKDFIAKIKERNK